VSSPLGNSSIIYTLAAGSVQYLIFSEAIATTSRTDIENAILAKVSTGPAPGLSWNATADRLTLAADPVTDTTFNQDVIVDYYDFAGNMTNEILILSDTTPPGVSAPLSGFTELGIGSDIWQGSVVFTEELDATSKAAVETAIIAKVTNAVQNPDATVDYGNTGWDAAGTTYTITVLHPDLTNGGAPYINWTTVVVTDLYGNTTGVSVIPAG